jgi:hypothetical protein
MELNGCALTIDHLVKSPLRISIPFIEDLFDQMKGAGVFLKIDLRSR